MSCRVTRLARCVVLGAVLAAVLACGRPAVDRVRTRPPGADPCVERGIASWYGRKFHGRTTASGERYDMRKMTAAHRSLPFGTRVRVVHEASGRSIEVRINDRGPFVEGRIIDLSRKAASELGMREQGIAWVRVIRLDRACRQSVPGS